MKDIETITTRTRTSSISKLANNSKIKKAFFIKNLYEKKQTSTSKEHTCNENKKRICSKQRKQQEEQQKEALHVDIVQNLFFTRQHRSLHVS